MGGKTGGGGVEMRSRADGQCTSVSSRVKLGVVWTDRRIVVYHGARARYHYFACLQVLLRKQAKVLMEAWKLPPEFEVCGTVLLFGMWCDEVV